MNPDLQSIREAPTESGVYFFSCDENDGFPELVAVFRQKQHMVVYSRDHGVLPLHHFHDGLTNPRWIKEERHSPSQRQVPDDFPISEDGVEIGTGRVIVRSGEWFYTKCDEAPSWSGWNTVACFLDHYMTEDEAERRDAEEVACMENQA